MRRNFSMRWSTLQALLPLCVTFGVSGLAQAQSQWSLEEISACLSPQRNSACRTQIYETEVESRIDAFRRLQSPLNRDNFHEDNIEILKARGQTFSCRSILSNKNIPCVYLRGDEGFLTFP